MTRSNRSDLLEALVEKIRAFCRANADEKVHAKYARYFREGYDAYGVDGKALTEEARRIHAEHANELGFAGFMDLCTLLMESGKYEESGFAVRFVRLFADEFSRDTFERVGSWLSENVRNWAVSDSLCADVLSPMLASGIVSLSDFDPWRESEGRWKRRAVPVSMLILLKEPFHPDELLGFIGPMMMDGERVVHQGLGWFLRETWKKVPKETEAFLFQWKDTAPRLIFQYATEKMTAEERSRFRAVRSKRR